MDNITNLQKDLEQHLFEKIVKFQGNVYKDLKDVHAIVTATIVDPNEFIIGLVFIDGTLHNGSSMVTLKQPLQNLRTIIEDELLILTGNAAEAKAKEVKEKLYPKLKQVTEIRKTKNPKG